MCYAAAQSDYLTIEHKEFVKEPKPWNRNMTYKEWAAETTIGRHICNSNYRMVGNEFRGWKLVKTVIMHKAPELTEKIYMWQKKGSEGHQLARISVAELPDWQSAQTQLDEALRHRMRSDIPRGTLN